MEEMRWLMFRMSVSKIYIMHKLLYTHPICKEYFNVLFQLTDQILIDLSPRDQKRRKILTQIGINKICVYQLTKTF